MLFLHLTLYFVCANFKKLFLCLYNFRLLNSERWSLREMRFDPISIPFRVLLFRANKILEIENRTYFTAPLSSSSLASRRRIDTTRQVSRLPTLPLSVLARPQFERHEDIIEAFTTKQKASTLPCRCKIRWFCLSCQEYVSLSPRRDDNPCLPL